MKRIIATILIAAMVIAIALSACGGSGDPVDNAQQQAEAQGLTLHRIGVAVYNIADAEVMAFRNYLEDYIESCFSDVDFYYSNSITNAEDELKFINGAIDAGVEGIMSFITYDIKAEVETCAENGVYYMLASGTVSDEAFESVADNEYFLGIVGPGSQIELSAAGDMAKSIIAQSEGDTYLVLSGGGSLGNDMHYLRTRAILDELVRAYGITGVDTDAMALSADRNVIEGGGASITVLPGYISREQYREQAAQEITGGGYAAVMSAMAVTNVLSELKSAGVCVGVIDSFTEDNRVAFQQGTIHYVAGKYCSEIGPSFAAMYNAVTGHADGFRDNGRAFRITQGFWSADSFESYDEMNALASGTVVNAYNYEDLYSVCVELNPDASLEELVELAQAYTYDDALTRRAD